FSLTTFLVRQKSTLSSPFNQPSPPPLENKEDQQEFEELVRKNLGSRWTNFDKAVTEEEETAHPDVRRKPPAEFEGDKNPVTGEINGPKHDPLKHGDWSYGARGLIDWKSDITNAPFHWSLLRRLITRKVIVTQFTPDLSYHELNIASSRWILIGLDKMDSGPSTPSTVSTSSQIIGCDIIRYRTATELVHLDSGESGVKDNYNASSTPIYQTATFKQNSATEMGDFDYTRSGNPTRSVLEIHLAKIMSAKRAFAVSSGMSAFDAIARLVRSGEEIIAGDDLYGGTNRLLSYLHKNYDIKTHHIDMTNPTILYSYLHPTRTRLVLLETPTNPLIKIYDIPTIASIVHEHCPNALIVVDNTMMSPYLQKPLKLGADITYHSGTKYLSGHHDLMAGVIGVNDDVVAEKIYFAINATGCGLSPFDSWLLLRGVKTLAIRMDKQQANAQQIAEFLEYHGFKVNFPGLKSHPQHDLHFKMSRGPGAVLSFLTGDTELSERIVESTKLWAISVSFGCVNSLISMPCRMSHASIPAAVRAERNFPEDLIRLCVGIEDVNDLIEDLYQALVNSGALKYPNGVQFETNTNY
ncbi:6661_t:CDS:2, partial [Ambispora leptoticha]